MNGTLRPMPEVIRTERLTLKPFVDEDAEVYREIIGDLGDGVTIEEIVRYFQKSRATTLENGIFLYAVHRLAERDIIGLCGLIIGRVSLDEPELAYDLLDYAHQKGYATEAAAAVIEAAAATGRQRLWSTVRTWNAPSFRVLEKTGFRRDHTTTDDRGGLVWNVRDL